VAVGKTEGGEVKTLFGCFRVFDGDLSGWKFKEKLMEILSRSNGKGLREVDWHERKQGKSSS
jgi:hypothetical protein